MVEILDRPKPDHVSEETWASAQETAQKLLDIAESGIKTTLESPIEEILAEYREIVIRLKAAEMHAAAQLERLHDIPHTDIMTCIVTHAERLVQIDDRLKRMEKYIAQDDTEETSDGS